MNPQNRRMEQSDSIHIAVGGILLGVGGVALSILAGLAAAASAQATPNHPWTAIWFLAGSSGAGALGLMGLYMTVAVYAGWKLPRTAHERRFQPRLRVAESRVLKTEDDDVVFGIKFANDGRGDIDRALLNIVAPRLLSLDRCSEAGEIWQAVGSWSRAPAELEPADEDSVVWGGYVGYRGRTHTVVYFRARTRALSGFPIRLQVTADELAEPMVVHLDLTLPEQQLVLVPAPEKVGPES
jgi:hypothetical protein